MKKFLVVAVIFSFLGSVCYGQSMYTENRKVDNFNAVSSCCGIDVYITEGSSSTLKVETNHQDILSRIVTEVKGKELKVSLKDSGKKRPNNLKMNVYVSASNLVSIKASSSADIYSVGKLSAEDINLSASSSGDIKLDLKAKNVKCSASSSGDIKLNLTAEEVDCSASSSGDITIKGSASFARLDASSSGDIDIREMPVKVAHASASSSGDIDVYVTEELVAKASSGSDIKYWGNPKSVDKKQNSGGSIEAR